jgi:thioredoxin:protein disulfide reductase
MKTRTVAALAVLAFGAVVIIPELLSFGATSRLDSTSALASGNLWLAAGIVFAGGVLTALTPCVFPLIPITVAIFSGQRQGPGASPRSRGRAAALTSAYVLGMAATFVALGIAAGLSGKAFGSALSSPVVSLILAGFFIALAASMFGAFEIALPSALALKLNQVGGAGFLGAFSMGLVAGLVAAPCTGPVLFGILAYVAAHQSVGLGSALLFLYALGVGVPFFVIGVFSFSLGKSGPWMDAVKSIVGIVLLAMALGYLRSSLPPVGVKLPSGTLAVYGLAGLVALGIFLGAVHHSFHGSNPQRVLKAVGVTLVVLGVTLRLDVESTALAQSAEAISWRHDLDAALAAAKQAHQPVFVDFYADWCAACKELDRKTYPDARVQAAARRFVAVKIDGTHESDALDKVYDRYGIQGLPTVIFVKSDGTVLKDPRVVGFVEPAEMVDLLKRVN